MTIEHDQRLDKLFIGYVRNSTEMQRDNYSAETQREFCLNYAKQHGYVNVKILEEQATSGQTIEGRPVFKSILDQIARGIVGAVAAIDVNRFTRDDDYIDGWVFFRACKENDVLIVTKDLVIDPNNATMQDLFGIKLMGSRMQNEANLAALTRGLWKAAEDGQLFNGVLPFGYNREPMPGSRKPKSWWVVNDNEAAVIRLLHSLIADVGTEAVARELNERGYRFPVKSPGTQVNLGRQRNGGIPITERLWRGTDVLRLLRSPLYVGRYQWGGKRRDSKHYRGMKEAVSVTIPSLRIVDEVRWQASNALLDSRQPSRISPRAATSPYIFSGVLKCPKCSGPMKGSRKRTTDPAKRAKTYRCANESDLGTCEGVSVRERIVCRAVRLDLGRLLPRAAIVEVVDFAVATHLSALKTIDLSSYDETLAKLEEERRRTVHLYVKQILSEDEVQKELKALKDRQQRTEELRRRDAARQRHTLSAAELRAYVGDDLRLWIGELRGQRLGRVAKLVYERFEVNARGDAHHREADLAKASYTRDFTELLALLRGKQGKNRAARVQKRQIPTHPNH